MINGQAFLRGIILRRTLVWHSATLTRTSVHHHVVGHVEILEKEGEEVGALDDVWLLAGAAAARYTGKLLQQPLDLVLLDCQHQQQSLKAIGTNLKLQLPVVLSSVDSAQTCARLRS